MEILIGFLMSMATQFIKPATKKLTTNQFQMLLAGIALVVAVVYGVWQFMAAGESVKLDFSSVSATMTSLVTVLGSAVTILTVAIGSYETIFKKVKKVFEFEYSETQTETEKIGSNVAEENKTTDETEEEAINLQNPDPELSFTDFRTSQIDELLGTSQEVEDYVPLPKLTQYHQGATSLCSAHSAAYLKQFQENPNLSFYTKEELDKLRSKRGNIENQNQYQFDRNYAWAKIKSYEPDVPVGSGARIDSIAKMLYHDGIALATKSYVATNTIQPTTADQDIIAANYKVKSYSFRQENECYFDTLARDLQNYGGIIVLARFGDEYFDSPVPATPTKNTYGHFICILGKDGDQLIAYDSAAKFQPIKFLSREWIDKAVICSLSTVDLTVEQVSELKAKIAQTSMAIIEQLIKNLAKNGKLTEDELKVVSSVQNLLPLIK